MIIKDKRQFPIFITKFVSVLLVYVYIHLLKTVQQQQPKQFPLHRSKSHMLYR